jgi:hypothetical protein
MRPVPRRPAARAAAAAGLLVALAMPAGAAAFPLDGCRLSISSLDGAGRLIDTAEGPGDAGTRQDPLRLTWDGTVSWSGGTGSQVIRGTSWHVDLFGLPTPLRGGDPNDVGDRSGSDSVRVSEAIPFRLAGLYFVSGRLTGDGGSCPGSGWILLLGEPLSTIPCSVGLALLLLGAVLLAVGARGAWPPAIVGGVLLGIGGAMLLVSFAVLPLGEWTPPGVIGLGLLAGLLAGWLGRVRLPPRAPLRPS